ncbi:RING finger protein 225-like [Bombina bombina]|uniref:RING finger protein 225-like n=1 Tax=Bombina bombina TaxID=8345 RepID=UPI00235AC93C|nr:RING finger protein 225-like [Bombina bombina]XP_053577843.1 RING finger protein 225-like [Bombina bombina]XP_053577844.1 RING finger protein 225-like [Bombina bombina]XP_053577845.1 RING finger protein 225-like [Bombina bombina]
MSDEPPNPLSEGDGISECIVCFTPYDALFHLPKILTCGHVFCLECLSRITVGSTEPESIPCPICRKPTPLPPKKGPPALSTDQDLLKSLNKTPSCPIPSLRFSRQRGLLYIEKKNSLNVSTVSLSVDLGRPPPPARSPRNLRSLFRNGGCLFYGSIGAAVFLTIALVLAGVYIFYLVPFSMIGGGGNNPPGPNGVNITSGAVNNSIGPGHN